MMTTWKYDREWARLGYQKMECLLGTLCRRMGEGCGPSLVLPETSGYGCNYACTAGQRTSVGSLAGGSSSGLKRPTGDASGSESPCAEMDWQRPIDLPEVSKQSIPLPHLGPGAEREP